MKNYWLSPIVLLAAAAGCGMPVLYDTAGQPVEEPELMAQVGGLWLAVDSSEAGVRAVLEIQVAAPGGQIRTWDVAGLKLWTGSGPALSPARVKRSNVRCWPDAPRGVPCRTDPDDPQACVWQMQPGEAECYYILCAEFALEQLPKPTEPIVLNMDGSLTVLQLAVVK
jgi:hypothetical protein